MYLRKEEIRKAEANRLYFYDGKNFFVGSQGRSKESVCPEDLPKQFRRGTKVMFQYPQGADLCWILESAMRRKNFLSRVSNEYTSRPEQICSHYFDKRY